MQLKERLQRISQKFEALIGTTPYEPHGEGIGSPYLTLEDGSIVAAHPTPGSPLYERLLQEGKLSLEEQAINGQLREETIAVSCIRDVLANNRFRR